MDNYQLPMNSGQRSGYGAAIALVRIFEEIFMAMDNRLVTFLCLLDNMVAFDNVDYDILLKRSELFFASSARD